jgi:hypothetical protein
MFRRANNFNCNLGNWALNPTVNLSNMFDNSGLDCKKYTQTLIAWGANPNTKNNKVLGATSMEFIPEAQSAVNNLIVNKGWGFSGHDINTISPTFNFQNTFCQGAPIPALPIVSENGIQGIWQPQLNANATTNYTFVPSFGQCAVASNLTININPIAAVTGAQNQSFGSNSTTGNIVIVPSNVIWFATAADALANINPLSLSTTLVD